MHCTVREKRLLTSEQRLVTDAGATYFDAIGRLSIQLFPVACMYILEDPSCCFLFQLKKAAAAETLSSHTAAATACSGGASTVQSPRHRQVLELEKHDLTLVMTALICSCFIHVLS